MTPRPISLHPVVQWLVHGARNAPLSQEVLTELCERLIAAGLPLWRVTVFVRTLHPEIVGRRFVWHPETGTVVTDGSFELLERRAFLDSPMVHVSNTGEAFRRRLADPDCVMDYPVLHDLRDEGVTDYVVAPLHFSGGEVHFSSWATRQPGGFTDAQIEVIQSLIAPLARVAEIRAWYRVAGNLLTTYVGKNAGERGTDSPRRYRGDQCRDLAVRHARLHCAGRHAAAAGSGRSAQSLFRLPGAGDRRAWRRSAQIYGRRTVGNLSDRRRARFLDDLRRRPGSRQSGARSDCRAVCERRRWQRPALWFSPACRRCAVRQYRQRQPAGFHLHRPGGQLGGAA